MTFPSAVMFDMDGTLTDTEPLWHEGEFETMRAFGYRWTEHDQRHCYGLPIAYVSEYMSARVPDVSRAMIVASLMDTMAELIQTRFAWAPGAREFLLQATDRGLPLAMVSASWRRLVDHVLDAIRLDLGRDPFAVSVAGDEVGAGKPDPEPYLLAAARLGVNAEQCLVIEDSPAGVASGLAAGARVLGIEHVVLHQPVAGLLSIPTLAGVSFDQVMLGIGGGVPPQAGQID